MPLIGGNSASMRAAGAKPCCKLPHPNSKLHFRSKEIEINTGTSRMTILKWLQPYKYGLCRVAQGPADAMEKECQLAFLQTGCGQLFSSYMSTSCLTCSHTPQPSGNASHQKQCHKQVQHVTGNREAANLCHPCQCGDAAWLHRMCAAIPTLIAGNQGGGRGSQVPQLPAHNPQ